jgi:phosphomannomutase
MKLNPNVITSISGIRGLYPTQFSSIDAIGLITAFIRTFSDPSIKILISWDARPGSIEMSRRCISFLNNMGIENIVIGLAPLPTSGIVVKKLNCTGGIVFTASHNPAPWHGLKFLDKSGEFINSSTLKKILKNFHNETAPKLKKELTPNATSYQFQAYQEHLEKFPTSNYGYRIGIDAVNNSGSYILPMLVEQLGCRSQKIACNPELRPNRDFEPSINTLFETSKIIKKSKVDFGIAVDPDADRLILISESGQVLSEEYTIVLSVWNMLLENYPGDIVVNLSTSSMIDGLANRFNRRVYRSKIGEKNVVDKMKSKSLIIGGEGNGGVIDGRRHYSRDSLSALYHITSLLNKTSKTLDTLVSELPKSSLLKTKIDSNNHSDVHLFSKKIIDYMREKYNIQNVSDIDGIKINMDNNEWVQVRGSNTEPVIRIFAESSNKKRSQELINDVSLILS